MSQRSPYNDRYKVDQKGKTRRSASSARPSRAVGELGTPRKKKARSTAWGRAKAASKSTASRSSASKPVELPPSPRMLQLRKYWWIAWIAALAVAIVILIFQSLGKPWVDFNPIGWGIWLIAMGIAFYLEFVPIKKERNRQIEAAKARKGDKAEKSPARASKSGGAKTAVPTSDHEAHGSVTDSEEDAE